MQKESWFDNPEAGEPISYSPPQEPQLLQELLLQPPPPLQELLALLEGSSSHILDTQIPDMETKNIRTNMTITNIGAHQPFLGDNGIHIHYIIMIPIHLNIQIFKKITLH